MPIITTTAVIELGPAAVRTDVKKPPTEKKLSRLVTRLLEGGVVPFIGAGVSYDCVSKESGEQIARTGDMRCNVCKAIDDDYRNHPHRCEDGCRNKEDSRCVNDRSLSEVCEEYVWRDGHSYEKLVMQVLRIGEFTKLKPTPAHRYLAFLAREGLVEEIITSNFDTCISQAFAQTFEDERVACESYAIVSNLEEYRKAGGRRSSAHGHPFLKIYHINGCAGCLTGGGSANGCESILLTERQLQDWRDRHWGRELLKDRLRCRSVVFSGFGSPEPQVRHTVLQVVEEFQAHLEPSPERPTDGERNAESREVWERPNAPFLHSYERSLSFQQKQILMGYATANRMNCSVASVLKDGNVFSPEDKGLLSTEEATTRDKLKADHFWATVYQATFWELLRKAYEPQSPFWYYLSPIVSCAEALTNHIMEWLLPSAHDGGGHSMGRFRKLLCIDPSTDSLRLSTWLWYARYRTAEMKNGWYASLRDRMVLIPAYFLLLYLVMGIRRRDEYTDRNEDGTETIADVTWDDVENATVCSQYVGLAFKVKLDKLGKEFLISLAHAECGFNRREVLHAPAGEWPWSAVIQLLIGNSACADRDRLMVVSRSGSAGRETVRFVPVYRVPFTDVFARDGGPIRNVRAVCEAFENGLVARLAIADSARKHIRVRCRPIGR